MNTALSTVNAPPVEAGSGNGIARVGCVLSAPAILKSDADDKSAPDRVLQDKRLKQGAKVLWMYLKVRSNSMGQCWPTQRQIFAAIGCDGHSLKDWNEQLHEAGYLTFKKEPGRRNYTYTLRVLASDVGWLHRNGL
jgi:hypothetical protein